MTHQINAIQGDITKQNADAIVNAANRGLFGGSGVCGAIFDAAGYDDMTKACKSNRVLRNGRSGHHARLQVTCKIRHSYGRACVWSERRPRCRITTKLLLDFTSTSRRKWGYFDYISSHINRYIRVSKRRSYPYIH